MNKNNSLFEKRSFSLAKIIKEKIKDSDLPNESNNIINEIKDLMIKNSILDENENNNKISSIKNKLNSAFEIDNSKGCFFKYDKKNIEDVKRIEGHPVFEEIFINFLFKSEELLIAEIIRKKNAKEPLHENHDHKTLSILTKGKLKLIIDNKEFIAEKGDLWIYKPGNHHSIEALEDSTELSIKFPPVKTW